MNKGLPELAHKLAMCKQYKKRYHLYELQVYYCCKTKYRTEVNNIMRDTENHLNVFIDYY